VADANPPVAPPAPKAAAPAEPMERVALDDYTPTGPWLVKTKHGYTVEPSDLNLPIVGADGVQMSKDQAVAVVGAYEEYIASVEEIKE
jgi:hypothetical protein